MSKLTTFSFKSSERLTAIRQKNSAFKYRVILSSFIYMAL
ncbi:hypothetical protein VCHA30O60_40137 [Vibrio chagasii]|nr:hypothetical protein VCHA30O60_40137 [Vibrio chagasii]